MSRSLQAALILVASGALAACAGRTVASTAPRPPVTRTVDADDDFHGTKVPDPYRWLEDLESPEVRDWAAAQRAMALPYLRDDELRAWVRARLGELRAFWSEPRADTGEPSADAGEPPVIDERTLGAGQAIAGVRLAPDRRHAAYAVATEGSEWLEVRIRRLADGADLDERLDGLRELDASWTKDGRGFFYVRSLKPGPGERASMKGPVVYYHAVGTPQSSDVAILRTPPGATDLALEQALSEDGRHLVIYEGNAAYVDGIGWLRTRVHVLDLGDPSRPALGGRVVALSGTRDAAYRVLATNGDSLFLFTDRDAPRRRLVVLDIRRPGVEHWRDVVPQTDDVIDQVHDIGGRFVVQFLRDVQHGVRVYERDGRLVRELPIAPMTVIGRIRAGAANELVVEAREGGFAPTRRRYDVVTGRMTVEREPKLPFPADAYEVRQVWYPSKDGVRVPMFLVHRRSLVLDGSHPAFMVGYGASGQLTLPDFGEGAVPLLELGLVLAAPALRGGGELGRTWYEAATLERKQAAFDDFIAAAEYLIRERYTTPDRLAIQGGSNGGLLVTAVINQRPELFRVAVANAPATDLLRFDAGTHAAQLGTPRNPAHFPFIRAYSPLQNVRPGTCYPATLVTTTFDDAVLPAWHALKHAAALQAAQSCDRPVLLRADATGGHGGPREGFLDTFVFIARQLGLKLPEGARP